MSSERTETLKTLQMKTFTITTNQENINWVNDNLDVRDFLIHKDVISIIYYNEMQKADILNAITK